jgi:hypothetical protein
MAGIGVLGSITVARAQPDTTGPNAPPVMVPPTIPGADEQVSPSAPAEPGVVPPLVTPQALPPPAPPSHVETTPGYPVWMTKIGTALMLGGGFEDFTNSNIRSMTGGGGSWDARIAAGTRHFVGLEAAYIGAVRGINALGLPNTNLVSNGLEGNIRFNLPIVRGPTTIEPFAFGGIGWQHYSISQSNNNFSDILNSDDVMAVPFGAGLMYSYDMFMLDARFTYRETFFNDMFRATGEKLNTWGVGGNIGVEF